MNTIICFSFVVCFCFSVFPCLVFVMNVFPWGFTSCSSCIYMSMCVYVCVCIDVYVYECVLLHLHAFTK